MLSRDTTNVSDVIANYLRQRFPAFSGRPIDDATPLLVGGAIDSLGILDLMMFLGERFGVEIADEDFEPGNFETFKHLVAFTERKRS